MSTIIHNIIHTHFRNIYPRTIHSLPYMCRDANFYGLPVVTKENCKNFQFATDYGKLEFFYGNLKRVVIRNIAKTAINERI